MIAFIFPGQGGQSVGMGSDLYARFPTVRETFDLADQAFGGSPCIASLCFSGPKETLVLTENAQPCMLTVCTATHRLLVHEQETKPDVVAGHSLGEYTALVAAGALDFVDAVRLVRKRGEFMRDAITPERSAMAAVSESDLDTLNEICSEASDTVRRSGSTDDIVVPANLNSPRQVVLSGHRDAVECAITLIEAKGQSAQLLRVSQPFHSPILKSAADQLAKEIERTSFRDASIPVITNVDAQPTTEANRFKELLVEQVTAPVRWRDSIDTMVGMGVTEFCEIGPGPVLTNMFKSFDFESLGRDVSARLYDSAENILAGHWDLHEDRRTHLQTGQVLWNDGLSWEPDAPFAWGF